MSNLQWTVGSGILAACMVFSGCTKDSPSIRIFNERTEKANVQLKTPSSNTININDVAGGTGTVFQDLQTGAWTATATIQSESVAPSVSFTVEEEKYYIVVVTNATPPTLRVDSSDK